MSKKRIEGDFLVKDALAFLPGEGFTPGVGVLCRNGRISALGRDLKAPPGCPVFDAGGAHLTPGLVDGHTHLGLSEPPEVDLPDFNEKSSPVTPQLRVTDAINPWSRSFPMALANGVTTVGITPGSTNVIGGQSAILKTGGGSLREMIIRDPAGLKMALGQNPKKCFGSRDQGPVTRMGVAYLVRDTFHRALEYREKRRRGRGPSRPPRDLGLESVLAVLEGRMPARIHCHRADDIATALRLADEFSFPFCLEHASEAWRLAEELARRDVPCFIGPNFNLPQKDENAFKGFTTASVLRRAGVRFALITDHFIEPVWFLPVAAGLAARQGLDRDDALRAITSWPAEIMGIAGRLGSLAPGLDADLVAWDGHPLALARPTRVFLNGREVDPAQEGMPLRAL